MLGYGRVLFYLHLTSNISQTIYNLKTFIILFKIINKEPIIVRHSFLDLTKLVILHILKNIQNVMKY